jgi:signal transduction histidine kinase
MRRWPDVARDYWFELLVGLLAVAGIMELVVGRELGGAPDISTPLAIATVAVIVVPLFLRRRWPFGGPAAYWVLAAALSFVDGALIPFVSSLVVVGMATAFLLGNLRIGARAVAGLVVVTVCIEVVLVNMPGSPPASLYVFIPLRFVVSWIAGYILRERADRAEAAELRADYAEREREAAARVAVAEERARIARELHDIVAHAVSVMVLQVGAVRHKLPDEMRDDREALVGVERAGRTALVEMRRLLGAMRRSGDSVELEPQPGLDRIESLVQDVTRAGLPVGLNLDGDVTPLPRAIDLSAYRIIQEGLTNSLKHARASRADVTVCYRPDQVEITVADDGVGATTIDSSGHGLVGIRERVKIYGGEMSADAAPGGGFVLSARLPLDGYRP